MNYLNIKYLNCFCEVRNKENKLVAAGSIQEISEQEFVIFRRNGNIPGLKEDMEVKVNLQFFRRFLHGDRYCKKDFSGHDYR